MGRALIILNSTVARSKAAGWIARAPGGTRVEFKNSKRTLPQNDRMWAMLTDVSQQAKHCGTKFTPEIWKLLFMAGCFDDAVQMVPTLDGKSLLAVGRSSADLSVDEMTELIEFMFAYGAENGVTFNEPDEVAA